MGEGLDKDSEDKEKTATDKADMDDPQNQDEEDKTVTKTLNTVLHCSLDKAVPPLKTSAEPATPPPTPSVVDEEVSQPFLDPSQVSSHFLMKSESTDSAVEVTEDLLEGIDKKEEDYLKKKINLECESLKENVKVNVTGERNEEMKKNKTNENCDIRYTSDNISDLAVACANGDEVSDRLKFAEITIQ